MTTQDNFYRTTYGNAYGYNERHGITDAQTVRGLPSNMPPPVVGKNYSSATFAPTYEYLANNDLREFTDVANLSYSAQTTFPYKKDGAVIQQNFSSATFPVTEKFAKSAIGLYDMREEKVSNLNRHEFSLYQSGKLTPAHETVALSSTTLHSQPIRSVQSPSSTTGVNTSTLRIAGAQSVRGVPVPQ